MVDPVVDQGDSTFMQFSMIFCAFRLRQKLITLPLDVVWFPSNLIKFREAMKVICEYSFFKAYQIDTKFIIAKDHGKST